MADAKKPSIEEILAAARKSDGAGGESAPPAKSAAEESAPSEEASPAPSASGKKPSEMSVAEMMAAARAEKSGDKPAAKAAPKPKPAAKAKPAAPAAAKKEPAKPSGPKDTASILAAARAAAKPGPVSKAEAAKAGQPVETKPKKPAKAPVTVPPMPQKPAYAKPKPAPAAKEATDRRGFFARSFDVLLGTPLAIGFTTLAVTHLLWLLGLARFMFPNVLTEPPTQFKVGFPANYAPGMVETKFKAEFGVWVVRYEYEGEQQIYALKSVCTHLGCTPNWLEGEQKFKCPCHGSGFYKDGINFEGPAPRPLERYAISLSDDGQLEVDKSRTFQEEMGQWADSSSYYPA